MKYADLHVHTDFSDGTFTPEEVINCANDKKLSSVAICDHDCVDAIDECIDYAKKFEIEVIPAVELTVIEEHKEIHMLGYFVSWKEKWFRDLLKRVQEERIVRMDKMIEKLKAQKVIVQKELVMRISGNKGSVGRLHLAKALLETKAVSSIREAFARYLGDFAPCYVEDIGFSAREAIDIIKKAKGLSVVAHPATVGNDSLIKKIIELGVDGIEIFHSDHSPHITRKYEKMAEENGLLTTGGSDCHGMGKGIILMGRVKVPYRTVISLKKKLGLI